MVGKKEWNILFNLHEKDKKNSPEKQKFENALRGNLLQKLDDDKKTGNTGNNLKRFLTLKQSQKGPNSPTTTGSPLTKRLNPLSKE